MAEAEYGDLFDFYCVKILAELYANRGRSIAFPMAKLAEIGPLNASEKLCKEAADNAGFWLHKHGYAEGSALKGVDRGIHSEDGHYVLRITPLGVAAYGRPFPGKEEISTGAKAAALIREAAKDGMNATIAEGVGLVMAQISLAGAVSWAKQKAGL